jgi:multiple sugar transport system ATP-binding protein
MARIELIGVSKRYGSLLALDDVSLTIEDNEFFCIFGPPTSGKTTLLRLLLGLEQADAGEIRIDGKSLAHASTASRNLAMVFQNLALFPHLSARENLRFPLVQQGKSESYIAARIDAVAAKLHIAHLLHKPPSQLSGGERQRIAIGRALVRDAQAYLMDDPIAALDARLREEMRIELKRLQRDLGKTLVYVTHDQEEAMAVGDRMAILEAGRVQQIDTPGQVYREPENRFVARLLGQPAMNFVRGTLDGAGTFSADDIAWQVNEPRMTRHVGPVDMAFRPERVKLTDPVGLASTGASYSTLASEVFESEPLGAQTIVTARAGKVLLKISLQGQHQFHTGEGLAMSIAARDRMYFDATSGARLDNTAQRRVH